MDGSGPRREYLIARLCLGTSKPFRMVLLSSSVEPVNACARGAKQAYDDDYVDAKDGA